MKCKYCGKTGQTFDLCDQCDSMYSKNPRSGIKIINVPGFVGGFFAIYDAIEVWDVEENEEVVRCYRTVAGDVEKIYSGMTRKELDRRYDAWIES